MCGCELAAPAPGRDLRCCALGKADAGYGWLRVQPGQPGVLLLRCLGPRRAEGSDGRHVRAQWFGHAHLPMSGHRVSRALFKTPCDRAEEKPSGGVERVTVSPVGTAVVGVEYLPVLEVGDKPFNRRAQG